MIGPTPFDLHHGGRQRRSGLKYTYCTTLIHTQMHSKILWNREVSVEMYTCIVYSRFGILLLLDGKSDSGTALVVCSSLANIVELHACPSTTNMNND